MRTARRLLLCALVLAPGPGCQRAQPGAADAAAWPAPQIGRAYDLSYLGELSLDLEQAADPVLLTRVELRLTARARPLERLDLAPGLRDLGVRPEVGPDAWGWDLVALDSDRALRLAADDERLSLQPLRPVEPGETWRVTLELESPVAELAQGVFMADLLPEADSAVGGLQAVLALGEQVLERFSKDAATSSFVEDGFHVLLPPWPLPYDCGDRPPAEAYPPLECVSHHLLPAEVRVEVPEGWEAVLPTPPVWDLPPGGPRVAVVDRLPSVLLLAPRVAFQSVEVDGRRIGLCAPPARSGDLAELGRLVAEVLPRLEAALGPYPQRDPIVCLSPTPLDLWGLARGRLALVDMETFSPGGPGLQGQVDPPGLQARLARWIREAPFFQALREELLLHELAHHWWRAELPDRWERLLSEGAASLVARELQVGATRDEARRYFARASAWLDAAQMELAGVTLPPLSAYLGRGPVPAGPAELLLPYLHGLSLLERLMDDGAGGVRWDGLRRLHQRAPGHAYGPEALLASDPLARDRLREVLAADQNLSALGRLDPVEHSMRCTEGLLAALAGDPAMEPLLEPLRRGLPGMRGLFRAQLTERLRALMGVEASDWARTGEVLRVAGDEDCVEPPEDPLGRQACLGRLRAAGLSTLGGLMDMADPAVWRSLDASPEAEELLFDRPREVGPMRVKARALLRGPLEVGDAEAESLGEDLSLAEARVELLGQKLRARWAAQAVLDLFPEGATAQTHETLPARKE